MFFGGTSFASAPFADPGFNPNALAIVTGNRINESTGTVGIVGKAIILPNGSRFNIGIGNVQVADVIGVSVLQQLSYRLLLLQQVQLAQLVVI